MTPDEGFSGVELRTVSVITRNIVASRSEAELLAVVCQHLVNSCGAEATAVWLTHKNKGLVTARPDQWFSNRFTIQQQPLLIDQNHLVGGLRGTGPYLKQILALPPIDIQILYVAAPLVFDGGIRGLIAAWALPNANPGLPDLLDLTSQLTAVRLRTLTDQSRMAEAQESIRSVQQELQDNRRRYLQEEQAATSGYLAALISQSWQPSIVNSLRSLESSQAALGGSQPLVTAGVSRAQHDLQTIQHSLSQLSGLLQSDPQVAELTRQDLSVNLMGLAAKLCLRNGLKLTWQGPETCLAASRSGTPAIFRAILLELFTRMKSNQSLSIQFELAGEQCLWGFYVDGLSPELEGWAQNSQGRAEPEVDWSAALRIASLLTCSHDGLLRFTPKTFGSAAAILRLPVRVVEGG